VFPALAGIKISKAQQKAEDVKAEYQGGIEESETR